MARPAHLPRWRPDEPSWKRDPSRLRMEVTKRSGNWPGGASSHRPRVDCPVRSWPVHHRSNVRSFASGTQDAATSRPDARGGGRLRFPSLGQTNDAAALEDARAEIAREDVGLAEVEQQD